MQIYIKEGKVFFDSIISGFGVSLYGDILNTTTNHICKSFVRKSGYRVIDLPVNKVTKQLYIHRIVTGTFITGGLDNEVVDHIDENKLNNFWLNLQPLTRSENFQKSHQTLGVVFTFCAPQGKHHTTTNCHQFAKQHGLLDSGIAKLKSGRLKLHRGWSIVR